MQNLWENYRAAIILGGLILIGLMLSIYIVPEEEQAVVLRTGEPVRVVNTVNGTTGAGLYVRLPLIESVRLIDKRLLDLEMTDEEVLSQDQQRLLVNAYARFRIVDPVRMVERAGTTDGVGVAPSPRPQNNMCSMCLDLDDGVRRAEGVVVVRSSTTTTRRRCS